MKIAIFHTTLPSLDRKVGGVEVVVHRLANALASDGRHSVTVFSLTTPPEDAKYSHRQVFEGAAWLWKRPLFRWFVLPVLLNALSFRGYDVLHLHGDDWFFLRRTVPTIRTLHGSALDEARSATSLARRLVQLVIYPLEHLAARLASIALAVGPEAARRYDARGVVPNGVDLDVFRPGPNATQPTLLFVGTWDGRKRGRFLYEQFVESILPAVPNAHLIMVSDTVSAACHDHPNVTVPDHPSDERLAHLYRKAWVFAYPSTYEGFGLPYIEAMASETAVCTSPNDGARSVLANGEYGCIVEDSEFASTCIRLLTDPSLRKDFAHRGLQRAQAYSWTAVAKTHLSYYDLVSSK